MSQRTPTRPPRPRGQFAVLAMLATLLGACAGTPANPQPRSKLNTYELRSMRAEILIHSQCVQHKAIEYAGGTNDIKLIADTAIAQCQGSLAQFHERLREFNLSDEAQRRYLIAVQIASKNMLTDSLLRARNEARKRSTDAGMGVSL